MTKKILSCFLAILLCALCLVGCSGGDEEVPDGMYSTTRDGEPFILYVPGDWSDNCDSGISSACVISASAVASARFYPITEGITLKDYVESIDAQYSKTYTGYESTAISSKESLNGKPAVKLQFKFDRGEGEDALNFTVTQYYTLHKKGDKSGVVLLSLYCPTDLYKTYETQFAKIKTEFVLKSTVSSTPAATDENAPKDMKNAAYDGVEYAFYVPTTWTTDTSDKMTEATSKDGKCNVTLTCFLSGLEMTVEEYFELCEEQYRRELGSYTRISSNQVHVDTVADSADEKNATTFVYEVSRGETTYKLSQTVLYYNGMFYSITYTALSENFDSHLEDLNLMLKNCSFK